MSDERPSASTLELLAWVSAGVRGYDETIERWKTSCPHLAVWDDAVTEGLVQVDPASDGRIVTLTSSGRDALARTARRP